MRRAVPALIIAFLLTICVGAFVQILDHRRHTVAELMRQIDASADILAERIDRTRTERADLDRRLQGELQLAQNSHSTSEPEQCFLLSHKIATCQKANLFAFRTAISLGRLWRQLGRQDEAHRVVIEARNQISGILPPRDLADLNSVLSG